MDVHRSHGGNVLQAVALLFHFSHLLISFLLRRAASTSCYVARVSSANLPEQTWKLHCAQCGVVFIKVRRTVVACSLTSNQWEAEDFVRPIGAREVDNKIWPPQTRLSDHIWQIHSWFSGTAYLSNQHCPALSTESCVCVAFHPCFFQMLYYFDLELVHAFIFIVPCLLLSLAKVRLTCAFSSSKHIK